KCKGWRCLYLDLSNLMGLTMRSWYTELGKKLADELTPRQITTLTNQVELRDYLLNQALPWLEEKPNIALLLDEVESVLKAGGDYGDTFSDTFFMTLRSIYNDRNKYIGKLVVGLAGA